MIKGLHHNAYRCRDSEETRAFYEDFLGLRMVSAFEINEGRALNTFFEMDDGSCLAFCAALANRQASSNRGGNCCRHPEPHAGAGTPQLRPHRIRPG
jgi:catechol 2,3-dioxygenase-like lactoylglutathione lyase family enzyme